MTIMSGVGAVSAYAVSVTPQYQVISTRSQPALFRPISSPSKRFSTINNLPLAVSFIFDHYRRHQFITLIDLSLPKTDQWLLVMSTQLIGFSIGGICKRILVAPPSMIWPVNLVTAALFNTLHSQETSGTHSSGGVARGRFFTYVFVGYLLYSQGSYLGKYCVLMLIGCRRRLLAFLSLYRSIELLLGMLDGSQQSRGQSVVRCHTRHVHGHPHIRLGSNHLQHFSAFRPLVGRS